MAIISHRFPFCNGMMHRMSNSHVTNVTQAQLTGSVCSKHAHAYAHRCTVRVYPCTNTHTQNAGICSNIFTLLLWFICGDARALTFLNFLLLCLWNFSALKLEYICIIMKAGVNNSMWNIYSIIQKQSHLIIFWTLIQTVSCQNILIQIYRCY